MYCCGTDILLDLITATYVSEDYIHNEVSSQVLRRESEQHREIEDIVRLPLKLPFPSLPLRLSNEEESKHTKRITGPDGNVCGDS